MIKILIVDDEPRARNILHHLIVDAVPVITEVRVASSGEEALDLLRCYDPDIVFLDIEMPDQTGYEMLMELKNPEFDIIFTTAHNDYAVQALRFNALDYLLKPVDSQELVDAVQRHLALRDKEKPRRELYENFISNLEQSDLNESRLAIPSNDGIYFFPVSQVLHLEADRNYTIIHLPNGKRFVACKTLKYFEEILEKFRFIRTHKSHLVNALHIVRISHGHEYLVLSNGTSIEISRRRRDALLHILKIR